MVLCCEHGTVVLWCGDCVVVLLLWWAVNIFEKERDRDRLVDFRQNSSKIKWYKKAYNSPLVACLILPTVQINWAIYYYFFKFTQCPRKNGRAWSENTTIVVIFFLFWKNVNFWLRLHSDWVRVCDMYVSAHPITIEYLVGVSSVVQWEGSKYCRELILLLIPWMSLVGDTSSLGWSL